MRVLCIFRGSYAVTVSQSSPILIDRRIGPYRVDKRLRNPARLQLQRNHPDVGVVDSFQKLGRLGNRWQSLGLDSSNSESGPRHKPGPGSDAHAQLIARADTSALPHAQCKANINTNSNANANSHPECHLRPGDQSGI